MKKVSCLCLPRNRMRNGGESDRNWHQMKLAGGVCFKTKEIRLIRFESGPSAGDNEQMKRIVVRMTRANQTSNNLARSPFRLLAGRREIDFVTTSDASELLVEFKEFSAGHRFFLFVLRRAVQRTQPIGARCCPPAATAPYRPPPLSGIGEDSASFANKFNTSALVRCQWQLVMFTSGADDSDI
jgi:hypothetical protein